MLHIQSPSDKTKCLCGVLADCVNYMRFTVPVAEEVSCLSCADFAKAWPKILIESNTGVRDYADTQEAAVRIAESMLYSITDMSASFRPQRVRIAHQERTLTIYYWEQKDLGARAASRFRNMQSLLDHTFSMERKAPETPISTWY